MKKYFSIFASGLLLACSVALAHAQFPVGGTCSIDGKCSVGTDDTSSHPMPTSVYRALFLKAKQMKGMIINGNDLTSDERAEFVRYQDTIQGIIVVEFTMSNCKNCSEMEKAIQSQKRGPSFLEGLQENNIAFYTLNSGEENQKSESLMSLVRELYDTKRVIKFDGYPHFAVFKNGVLLRNAAIRGYSPDILPDFLSYLISLKK